MDSFRRLIRGIRDFRTLLWMAGFLAATVAALWSGNAFAQQSGGSVRVTPVTIAPQTFTSTGDMLSHATYEGRLAAASTGTTPMAQSLYYQRQLVTPKATLANLVRARIKMTPAGAASALVWTAVIGGAGLFIDWINGQVQSTPDSGGQAVFATGTTARWFADGGCNSVPNNQVFANDIAGLLGFKIKVGTEPCVAAAYVSGNSICYNFINGNGSTSPMCSTVNTTGVSVGAPLTPTPVTDGTQASDTQIVDAVKAAPQNTSEEWAKKAWAEPFQWPTGQPKISNPMPAQMAEVASQYRNDTGVALAAGQTDPTYTDQTTATTPGQATTGSVANPAPAQQASASSLSVTFPVFCTWAATVCTALDFLAADTTTTPADVPVPEVNVPVTSQPYASGLGNGTCPGAVSTSFDFGGTQEISFSYQPMCDFAAYLNPLLSVLGALVAAFILSGVRRRA